MWLYYALTFAVCSSLVAILAKKILGSVNEYVYILFYRLFGIVFLFLAVVLFFQFPKPDNTFWIVIIFSSILSALGVLCDYRGIKLSDVSLVAPISAFNPVFTTILSLIILGEKVGVRGGIGILTIVVGAYLLKVSDAKKDILAPLKSLYTDLGVRYALVGSFIWSVNPILFKTAIFHTDPQVPPFVSLIVLTVSGIFYIPFARKSFSESLPKVKGFLFLFLLTGILAALGEVAGFTAYTLTNLGYVTAIFRTSMIFTVIFGYLFYKEKGIKDKLLGSMVMLIGVFILVS